MRPSNKMQKTIERIAKLNDVDLASALSGDVYIKIYSAYMDLVIEKPYPNTISVAHYYTQNCDLIQDPEITFLQGCNGKWYATSITQPPMMLAGRQVGGYQELVNFEYDDLEKGTYSGFYPKQQQETAIFANKWPTT